jgi:hypothetical protein
LDPVITQHLDAAARNLIIAQDLLHHVPDGLDQPSYEWVITTCFYSAVSYVNAYLYFAGYPDPRSHAIRNRIIGVDSRLLSLRDNYLELLNWSRDARYTLPHTEFGADRA